MQNISKWTRQDRASIYLKFDKQKCQFHIIVVSETLLTVEVHIIFIIFVAIFILAYQGTDFGIVLSGNK